MPTGPALNVKNLPFDAEGKRPWSNGICGCCAAPGTCLLACCCPCMVYVRDRGASNEFSDTADCREKTRPDSTHWRALVAQSKARCAESTV